VSALASNSTPTASTPTESVTFVPALGNGSLTYDHLTHTDDPLDTPDLMLRRPSTTAR